MERMEWDQVPEEGGGGYYNDDNGNGAECDGGRVSEDVKANGGGRALRTSNLGTNSIFTSKDKSKGMVGGRAEGMLDGVGKKVEGRKTTKNAMEMLMARKIPELKIKKPIKKKEKGAKSKFGKGIYKGRTVSSQLGIARFLAIKGWLDGDNGLDPGIGERNSRGSPASLPQI